MSKGGKAAIRSTRWLAAVVTAAILAMGALTLVAAGFSKIRTGHWPEPLLGLANDRSLSGSNPIVIAVVGLLAVLGVALLLTALLPGPQRLFSVSTGNPGAALINGSGIARLLEHRIDSIDGVSTVRARVHRGRIEVRVGTPLRVTDVLRPKVLGAATEVLNQTLPAPLPRIKLQVRSLS